QRTRPETSSSRSYPTMRRNVSLASRNRPPSSQMKMPMMLASTRRRILASRSWRSLYRRAFSSEIAACDANSSSTEHRPGLLLAADLLRREWVLRQRVIKDHALSRPDQVIEHGFGKVGR